MQIGRWRERGGGVAVVRKQEPGHPYYCFSGSDSLGWPTWWREDGSWLPEGLQSQRDLMEYLGPLEEKS